MVSQLNNIKNIAKNILRTKSDLIQNDKIAHRTPCVLLFLGIKMTQTKIDTLSTCQIDFSGSLTIEKITKAPYTAS